MTRRSERIHRQKSAAWRFIIPLFLCLHVGVFSASAVGAVETAFYPKIISLNGPWQRQFIDQFSLRALKPDKWAPVEIPSREGTAPTHFAAYRKTFALPAGNIDDRIIIHFKGVAFASQVYLNGRLVGGHGPTLEPFEHDLTPFLPAPPIATEDKDKNDNELIILVQDWTSVLEKIQGQEISADAAGQGSNKNGVILQFSPGSPFDKSIWYKTVAPMGGNHRLYGIWDDVRLEVLPGVHVDDVAVDALFADGKIRVTGQIHNQGAQAWQGMMTIAIAEGGDGKEIVVVDVADIGDVSAGQSKSFQVILDAKGVTPWEPNRPVLYKLRVDLRGPSKPLPHPTPALEGEGEKVPSPVGCEGGGLCYRKVIPFGYRQIIVKDHEIWLNGKKIHLFTASIGSENLNPDKLAERVRILQGLNINAIRFHGNIFPAWYYDMMDRMGMLVVAESAIYGSYVIQYNYESDLFFDNAAIHWRGLVRKFRNHPSVIVYSIENESIQYSHGNRAEVKFAELGRQVKKWDPTRPILFNGGDDPEGVADIISLHYPHELPFWNQYPKDAWWLGDVTSTYIDFFWYHKPDFKWRWERKKPLDIGEIGNFYGGAPHSEAILSGDDAYAQHRTIRDAAQEEVWKHTVEAARALDVAMINPWNPPAGPKANAALKEALKPVKLILYPQATERYYGGDSFRWKGVLLNDTREQKRLSIRYSLREQAGHSGNAAVKILGPFLIEPGGRKEVEIGFPLPRVRAVRDYEVKICVLGGDEIRKPVSVYPRPAGATWRRLKPVYLFDPRGDTKNLFKKLGLPYRKLTSMPAAAHATGGGKMPGILIIGKDALTKLDDKEIRKLAERIAAGRESTLILEQDRYPLGFPPGLTLNERHGTTLGFVAAPGHPVIKARNSRRNSSMHGNDLYRLWAADLNISRKDFNLPIGGGYRPLVVSGGTGGLIYASLIEKPGVGGTTLFSQLALVEKVRQEPAAAEVLFNAIRYLESPERTGSAAAGANMSRQGSPDGAAAGASLHLPDAVRQHLPAWGVHVKSAVLTDDYQGMIMMTAAELARQPHTGHRLEDWVKAGNILWLTGADDLTLPLINPPVRGLKVVSLSKERLPVKIAGIDSASPAASKPPGNTAENYWNASLLTQGLLNQYLYWPAPLPDVTYNFASLLPPSKWALELQTLSPGWWKLTDPALIVAVQAGKGLIIIDTLDWAELLKPQYASFSRPPAHFPPPVSVMAAGENQERALRLFTTLLTNIGARVDTAPFVQIEAEGMTEKTPGQPVMRNWEHHYWEIFKNNYIAASFRVPDFPVAGNESMPCFIDVKARSLIQMQDPPRMRVVLDGQVVGEIDVLEPRWQIYRFKVGKSGDTIPISGEIGSCPQISWSDHRIEVHLINNPDDAYNNRQLRVDWVRIGK